MVTDQNHSSDASREQEVIRRIKKIAKLFELDKQNAGTYNSDILISILLYYRFEINLLQKVFL